MEEQILEKFYNYLDEGDAYGDHNISFAGCKALEYFVNNCQEITKAGFIGTLNSVLEYLIEKSGPGHRLLKNRTNLTLRAVCNFCYHIFTKEISKNQELEMNEILIKLQKKAHDLSSLAEIAKEKIIKHAKKIWRDDMTILTHGYSSIVHKLIKSAVENGHMITVYVTEGRPDNTGDLMKKTLEELNVPVKLILDSSVASIMAKIDYVFFGAEAVVENGGIINKIGTFTISL
jgi:translation initiation factor eIF-2B subunit alpha